MNKIKKIWFTRVCIMAAALLLLNVQHDRIACKKSHRHCHANE